MYKTLVGDEEMTFYTSEALLQSTTLDGKHGLPERHGLERPRSIILAQQLSIQHDISNVLFDKDRSQMVESNEPPIDLTGSDADHELKGKFFYYRKAFRLFLNHLYNAELAIPKESDGRRALFKADVSATCYDVEALQNDIMKTLQKYYATNMIAITDRTPALGRSYLEQLGALTLLAKVSPPSRLTSFTFWPTVSYLTDSPL